jgi:hypothetical protein
VLFVPGSDWVVGVEGGRESSEEDGEGSVMAMIGGCLMRVADEDEVR